MKKKLMAAVVAMAVMMFGTTAFAAGSPTAGSTKADTTVAAGQTSATTVVAPTETADNMAKNTTVGNPDVTVKAVADTTVTEAVTQAKNILNNVSTLGTVTGNAALTSAATDANKTVTATVLSVVNLESTSTNKTVVVNNSAIKAGKTYVVLHYTEAGWVTLPATVTADGVLSFTADSFSPFAIVEISVTDKGAATPGATTTPADKKADGAASPKTGETIPAAVFGMLVCVAGVVACAKRKEDN